MKFTLNCLLALLLACSSSAQQATFHQPLAIGDTLPEMTFTHVINSESATINFSQYKGKLLILDFWATWCPPCVQGLIKLSKYQQEYKKDIQVIPVNNGAFNDTRAKVTAFLHKRTDIALPTIYDDSMQLAALFPHDGIPHCVIIDKEGKVKAITSSQYLTASNIALLIQDSTPNFPLKRANVATAAGNVNQAWLDTTTVASFRIYRYIPDAYGTTVSTHNGMVKTTYLNRTIPELYVAAFDKARYIRQNRVIIEPGSDTSEYYNDLLTDPYEQDKWNAENRYCYESIIPAFATAFKPVYMQEDLNRYFFARYGITAMLTQRPVNCLKIVKRSTNTQSVAAGSGESDPSVYTWQSVAMIAIAQFLTNSASALPVIDGTKDGAPLHFRLKIDNFSELSSLRAQFRQQAFDLVESVETMEVLLIKKN